jgi:hypothetical protein
MASASSGKRAEPAVVSVALIVAALEEEERWAPGGGESKSGGGGSAGGAAAPPVDASGLTSAVPKPATAPHEALSLTLSFKGLLKIENMNLLPRLRRLRLDNNSLTRIEGLESVPALEWLDLSFNKLREVQGLGPLTQLRDLSLYNNEISSVAGLEAVAGSLQVLSLGNNLLLRLEDTVIALRKMRAMEVLTLEGNPLCKPVEGQRTPYKVFVHGFLPRLKYLDYAMVTQAEKAAARDGGVPAELLQEAEDHDAREQRKEKAAAERAAMVAELAAMNIEFIETLLDAILDEDPDFQKVKNMSGLPQLVVAMREAIKEAAATLRVVGAEKDALIRAEIAQFEEARSAEVEAAHADTAAAVADWERKFKHAARDAAEAAAALAEDRELTRYGGTAAPVAAGAKSVAQRVAESRAALAQLAQEAQQVEARAVRLELGVHESIEAMLDTFDTAMVELRTAKVANHESFYRALEAAEGVFSEAVQKQAEKVVADFAKGNANVDDEDFAALLGDKEALYGALAQAHETRVARILKSEGELKAREERRCGGAVAGARVAELARNRGRVFEVATLREAAAKRCAACAP